MQPGPDAGAGAELQEAYRLAAIAQGQHEEPGAPVLAAVRVKDHRPGAIIDLGLLAGCGDDHRAGFGRLGLMPLADKALDAVVAAGEAVLRNQVLPDRHGIATPGQPQLDGLPIGLASTGRRTPSGTDWLLGLRFTGSRQARVGGHLVGRFCQLRVGGHLVGRFCGRPPSPTAGRSQRDPGGFQVSTCSFATYTGSPLDTPQRPSQRPQCYDLLFLFFAQDIAHTDAGYEALRRSQCPGCVVIVGRFSGDHHWPDLGDR